jgi:DNA invertase Pin-like site-specific DNA recombinase
VKAVIYIRVSTKKQATDGAGTTRQLDACIQLAQSYGYTIFIVYCDRAVSGSTPLSGRPILRDALEQLHKDDIFVVSNLSRVARRQHLFFYIESIIRARGARLISAKEPAANNQDADSASFCRKAAMRAEYDRELCIQRTQAKLNQKKVDNERVGTITYGYKLAHDRISLEPHVQEQKLIKLVTYLYSLNYTHQEIKTHINSQGFRSRNNTLFQLSQIDTILKRHCSPIQTHKVLRKLKNVPYGYAYNRVLHVLEYSSYEQEIMSCARSLRTQKFSYAQIAAQLNALGYRNRNNNRFAKSQVPNMLTERTELGTRITPTQSQRTRALKTAQIAERKKTIYNASYTLRADGYSFPAIAHHLTQQGYTNPRNRMLTAQYIHYVLKDMPPVTVTKTAGPTNVAYGYTHTADFTIVPCVKEQDLITLVTQLHVSGYIPAEIVTHLTAHGYTNRAGKSFKRVDIDKLIKKIQA